MKRRDFLQFTLPAACSLPSLLTGCLHSKHSTSNPSSHPLQAFHQSPGSLQADAIIAGGGLGGCAAALALLRAGHSVLMTEETDWIGGQLTQQGVPPDENRWIESHGCTASYRRFRNDVRDFYRRHLPLLPEIASRPQLNPGDGAVSRLCLEPRIALSVLTTMLQPYLGSGRLRLLLEHKVVAAQTDHDQVRSLQVLDLRSGHHRILEAPYFIDATELGDLLPLTGTEFITGAEARSQHQELHAPENANPANQQAFTVCFAVDHIQGQNHVIDRPSEYSFWRDYVPQLSPPWTGKLLSFTASMPTTLQPRTLPFSPIEENPGTLMNLWRYRRIARASHFAPGTYPGDISLINWPQNDYWLGNLVGVSEREAQHHIRRAKQLSLSLLYWLQTEAPRPDGGQGWPGLKLRGDLLGSTDGLAKYPYIRESRRIHAAFTVTENHCGQESRSLATGIPKDKVKSASFNDSVGIGHYNIDLHPSSAGDNYIDVPSLPFEIPLGALLPVRMRNLLPAAKNLGVTHITNGCYRLHPVEWNIGEAAGTLIAFCLRHHIEPHAVREQSQRLQDFQRSLESQGFELRWPANT